MAYNETLSDRISEILHNKEVTFEEKKMFGGICYMVDDKMCVGVTKDNLMARVDPERFEELMEKTGAREMDFTGRPMKGFIFVGPEGYDRDADLVSWIDLCLEYNPKAKASKKK